VVINALLKDGPIVFEQINDICAQIGIPGSYEMCFHGFGHGVLAYAEYDLPDAIKMCGRVGTVERSYYEEEECLGGIIMEMRGGLHNPIIWEEQGKKYLDVDNPLAMCEASYMPDEYKDMCYIYITPFIFDEVSPQDVPPPSVFEEAMAWCARPDNEEHRYNCNGGFGKEFIGFVLGRDIRYLNNIHLRDAALVHSWCAYAADEAGRNACVEFGMYSTYRAGSIGFDGAYTFCGESITENSANICYEELFSVANDFNHSLPYMETFCAAAPVNRTEQCWDAYNAYTQNNAPSFNESDT